jgi:hypothetical protein
MIDGELALEQIKRQRRHLWQLAQRVFDHIGFYRTIHLGNAHHAARMARRQLAGRGGRAGRRGRRMPATARAMAAVATGWRRRAGAVNRQGF